MARTVLSPLTKKPIVIDGVAFRRLLKDGYTRNELLHPKAKAKRTTRKSATKARKAPAKRRRPRRVVKVEDEVEEEEEVYDDDSDDEEDEDEDDDEEDSDEEDHDDEEEDDDEDEDEDDEEESSDDDDDDEEEDEDDDDDEDEDEEEEDDDDEDEEEEEQRRVKAKQRLCTDVKSVYDKAITTGRPLAAEQARRFADDQDCRWATSPAVIAPAPVTTTQVVQVDEGSTNLFLPQPSLTTPTAFSVTETSKVLLPPPVETTTVTSFANMPWWYNYGVFNELKGGYQTPLPVSSADSTNAQLNTVLSAVQSILEKRATKEVASVVTVSPRSAPSASATAESPRPYNASSVRPVQVVQRTINGRVVGTVVKIDDPRSIIVRNLAVSYYPFSDLFVNNDAYIPIGELFYYDTTRPDHVLSFADAKVIEQRIPIAIRITETNKTIKAGATTA